MLAAFVTTEYRATVKFRMLVVPIAMTLTAFVCFWSAGISVAIYLLLLPLYMLPGKFERRGAIARNPQPQQATDA
jgi:ABC-type transport system involved in cytochrome bd biosynthesis fused ATPase/permease subunit